MIIAQQFTAGSSVSQYLVLEGRLNDLALRHSLEPIQPSLRDSDGLNWFISPAINRWAIIGCPYGTTTCGLTLNDNTMQRCA